MQTQTPFGPLLGLPPLLSPATTNLPHQSHHTTPSGTPISMSAFPSAFAAFASQIRTTQLQSLLQSQLAAIHGSTPNGLGAAHTTPTTTTTSRQYATNGGKIRTSDYPIRKRVGGSTIKTAKVWRYFDELPSAEQAAECRICRKKIKATNSSTTGMIRHLRSCHVQEYQVVQEARQNSLIVKMEEKARAKLLREMNDKVNNGMEMSKKDCTESQKSPSASSSASDTASSSSSTHFSVGIAAPMPIKPTAIKCEATEVEEDRPTDLSIGGGRASKLSAFSSVLGSMGMMEEKIVLNYQKKLEDDHKIHMQIALMLLLDQQPTQLIDRPGFRSLFKFLLPDYHLPTAAVFQSTIVPQLLNHMKQQIGAIFNGFNFGSTIPAPPMTPVTPITTNNVTLPNTNASTNLAACSSSNGREEEDDEDDMDEEVEEDEEENVEIEDDTSSASSSVDAETCDSMAALIHFVGNDTFPHDELISLLSVVANIFAYFESRPLIAAHHQMCVTPTTRPRLAQQVRFVARNLGAISNYIRHTPDMQLLPLSASQEALLKRLVERIDELLE